MITKNIFKTLALAMLMPAMLLATACSNQDDVANTSYITNKGYALPVTVNVTREDGATRATYTDNGNGTGSLGFSAGDKLFVNGSATGAGKFAGALDYVPATGKFSGTIYTQNDYDGTADALFSSAMSKYATLLPAGYDSYNFLSINNNNTPDVAYDDRLSISIAKAFVASETAKKTGVEQLSCEQAYTYSSGFALAPANAVLNFTISGLEAGAKTVTLITQYSGMDYDQNISGSVTPNASGVATFAIGVPNNLVIKNVANNLTVGSSKFTLSSTAVVAGKIYNITRSAKSAAQAVAGDVGRLVGADGKIYASATLATAAGTTAVAMIAYVGSETGESAPYNHGLALALTDENSGNTMNWSAAGSSCSGKNTSTPVTNATWLLASQAQWNTMINAFGGYATLRDGFSSIGGTDLQTTYRYWSSSDSDDKGYRCSFYDGSWGLSIKDNSNYARAALAF